MIWNKNNTRIFHYGFEEEERQMLRNFIEFTYQVSSKLCDFDRSSPIFGSFDRIKGKYKLKITSEDCRILQDLLEMEDVIYRLLDSRDFDL